MQGWKRNIIVLKRIFHFFSNSRGVDGKRKGGAFTRLAGNGDIPTHTFRQTFRHRQANARAGRRFTAVAVFNLIIHGEDLILLILRNADTRVLNFKVQHVPLIIANAHSNLSLLGKLHGVAVEIPQDLTQTRAVRHHFMRQRQRRFHHEAQSFLLGLQT